MCGRFAFLPDKSLFTSFKIPFDPISYSQFPNSSNISPADTVPVITNHHSQNFLHFSSWGFYPAWANPSTFKPLINARLDSLLTKPSFRADFANHRCIIPCSGFYEWSDTKEPYYFYHPRHKYLSLAGIYNELGFTIVTTTANSIVSPIHSRMPLILDLQSQFDWLSPDIDLTNLSSLSNRHQPSLKEISKQPA